MNRDEWIKEIPMSVFTAYETNKEQNANDACEQMEKLINAIHDDFESRTCESCKYGQMVLSDRAQCGNSLNPFTYAGVTLDRDFCCNKWEKK